VGVKTDWLPPAFFCARPADDMAPVDFAYRQAWLAGEGNAYEPGYEYCYLRVGVLVTACVAGVRYYS
jgi:hypothetical protein